MEKKRVLKMFEKLKLLPVKDFVIQYEKEARDIDLEKDYPRVYDILETQKEKYLNAEFENEISEVNVFCELALMQCISKLAKHIRENHKKATYTGFTPPFLIEVRLILEYDQLYFNTLNPKLTIQNGYTKEHEYDPNIVNTLRYQLREIEKLFKKDLERGEMIYNYYIFEGKHPLLDTVSLDRYLGETKVENFTFINLINRNCLDILDLWNNKLEKTPDKKLKHLFYYFDEKRGVELDTSIDFHTIYIGDSFKYYHDKKDFIASYNYVRYTAHNIATKCFGILDHITTAYPRTNHTLLESNKDKTDEVLKELHQFLINIDGDKKIDFLNELKLSFPTEKGKSIKAIIDILIKENLLVIGGREFNNFYKELKKHFNRDIGKYQAIQNVKTIHYEIKDPIETRINPLIIKYKTKQC